MQFDYHRPCHIFILSLCLISDIFVTKALQNLFLCDFLQEFKAPSGKSIFSRRAAIWWGLREMLRIKCFSQNECHVSITCILYVIGYLRSCKRLLFFMYLFLICRWWLLSAQPFSCTLQPFCFDPPANHDSVSMDLPLSFIITAFVD